MIDLNSITTNCLICDTTSDGISSGFWAQHTSIIVVHGEVSFKKALLCMKYNRNLKDAQITIPILWRN